MIGALAGRPPVLQALLAPMFTWGVTALGAALVFGKEHQPQAALPRQGP